MKSKFFIVIDFLSLRVSVFCCVCVCVCIKRKFQLKKLKTECVSRIKIHFYPYSQKSSLTIVPFSFRVTIITL